MIKFEILLALFAAMMRAGYAADDFLSDNDDLANRGGQPAPPRVAAAAHDKGPRDGPGPIGNGGIHPHPNGPANDSIQNGPYKFPAVASTTPKRGDEPLEEVHHKKAKAHKRADIHSEPEHHPKAHAAVESENHPKAHVAAEHPHMAAHKSHKHPHHHMEHAHAHAKHKLHEHHKDLNYPIVAHMFKEHHPPRGIGHEDRDANDFASFEVAKLDVLRVTKLDSEHVHENHAQIDPERRGKEFARHARGVEHHIRGRHGAAKAKAHHEIKEEVRDCDHPRAKARAHAHAHTKSCARRHARHEVAEEVACPREHVEHPAAAAATTCGRKHHRRAEHARHKAARHHRAREEFDSDDDRLDRTRIHVEEAAVRTRMHGKVRIAHDADVDDVPARRAARHHLARGSAKVHKEALLSSSSDDEVVKRPTARHHAAHAKRALGTDDEREERRHKKAAATAAAVHRPAHRKAGVASDADDRVKRRHARRHAHADKDKDLDPLDREAMEYLSTSCGRVKATEKKAHEKKKHRWARSHKVHKERA